jgi:signal transduction histidine kinase
MQQAFLNPIKNAAESIEEEGKVFIKARKHFEKEKTTVKDSGLGLYVVEEIIEEHDGRIGVCSEVGEGTSFLIRLPMGKA